MAPVVGASSPRVVGASSPRVVGATSPRKHPLATRRGELNRSKGGGPQILFIVIVVGVLLVVIISLLIRSIFFLSDMLVLSPSLLLSTTRTVSNHGDPASAASRPLAKIVQKESISINNNTLLSTRPVTPITVAYAISLIKCGDFQSSAAGMTDAALVMRHSIHQTSARNNNQYHNANHGEVHFVSHYDYKMYAIVHSQAAECSHILRDAGFEIVIKDAPVQPKEIRGDFLQKHIHKEWCCGHDEFIKLYAYTLPEPIVVHLDVDFVFHQPMDDVFDALLYDKDSAIGRAARARIPRERPESDPWPDQPQAMLTRDWPQVMPGRRAGYQAGFLVARTNPAVMDEVVEIVKEGNYVEGFQKENGWGGQGYGGFVGAMAMQGLMAYYYDIIAPDTCVELNQCRFNHMGMDVLFRGMPSFRANHPKVGKCRNNLDYCEDCMHTSLDKIHSIHFTQCRKPWNCIGEGNGELLRRKVKNAKRTALEKMLIPEDSVHLDHCMELLMVWHQHRADLENKLQALMGSEAIANQTGEYKKEVFKGHCTGNGPEHYILLSEKQDSLQRIAELYKEL